MKNFRVSHSRGYSFFALKKLCTLFVSDECNVRRPQKFQGLPVKIEKPCIYLKSTINFCVEVFTGGDKGIRTPDLLNAIQALSQLSYIPLKTFAPLRRFNAKQARISSNAGYITTHSEIRQEEINANLSDLPQFRQASPQIRKSSGQSYLLSCSTRP